MSVTVYGPNGSGAVTAYTVPKGREVAIETLTFRVLAGAAAGVHRVRVKYVDDAGSTVVTLDDLNESGPGLTTIYTYGRGLNASACTTVDGLAVTDALPWTQIKDGYTVTVTAVNDNGTLVAGDAISAVVLQVDDPAASAGADNTPSPLLVPIAV